jgi:hypothetical protein
MNVMDDVMWIVRRATKFDSESRDDNFCQEVVPHVSGLRSSSSGSKSSFGSGESRNRHSSESKVDMSSATRIEIIFTYALVIPYVARFGAGTWATRT